MAVGLEPAFDKSVDIILQAWFPQSSYTTRLPAIRPHTWLPEPPATVIVSVTACIEGAALLDFAPPKAIAGSTLAMSANTNSQRPAPGNLLNAFFMVSFLYALFRFACFTIGPLRALGSLLFEVP
jgi:hypothetical protein